MDAIVQPVPLVRSTTPSTRLQPWISNLARAFHKIYSEQKQESNGRDFIGLRDYYSLLKLLREEVGQQKEIDVLNIDLNAQLLSRAVARNLGGKPTTLPYILKTFHDFCVDTSSNDRRTESKDYQYPSPPSTLSLIKENLSSRNARHLMLLTQNDAALYLLFGCEAVSESKVNVLIGSRFKEDLHELHLIQQINQVSQFKFN